MRNPSGIDAANGCNDIPAATSDINFLSMTSPLFLKYKPKITHMAIIAQSRILHHNEKKNYYLHILRNVQNLPLGRNHQLLQS